MVLPTNHYRQWIACHFDVGNSVIFCHRYCSSRVHLQFVQFSPMLKDAGQHCRVSTSQSFSIFQFAIVFNFIFSICWNHLKVLNIRASHFNMFKSCCCRFFLTVIYLFHSCLALLGFLPLNWRFCRIVVSVCWFKYHSNIQMQQQ